MHIIEIGMKKPKYKKRMKKSWREKKSFLIEVHFLIAAPNGHPSKYWLGSMLLNLRVTKWPSEFWLKLALVKLIYHTFLQPH